MLTANKAAEMSFVANEEMGFLFKAIEERACSGLYAVEIDGRLLTPRIEAALRNLGYEITLNALKPGYIIGWGP